MNNSFCENSQRIKTVSYTVWKMSKYGIFCGPYFLWTEYGDLRSKIPYSGRIPENTDQKELRIWTFFTQCSQKIIVNRVQARNISSFFNNIRYQF